MPCHAILINSEFLTWALRYGDETALQVGVLFGWDGWGTSPWDLLVGPKGVEVLKFWWGGITYLSDKQGVS